MAIDGRGEREGQPASRSEASGDRLSAQLSALLLELVQTPELPVDGWSPEVREGGRIGRFELVRELGRGGFGVVYEALDRELSRTVALKLVKPGTRLSARGGEWLLREAEAVARLNHPNIVTLYDFGRGPTGPYLVLELLKGRTLAERFREGSLPVAEAVRVGLLVGRALAHAHAAGVVHRDLSAANVHLGDDGTVKVLDFGLSQLFGREGSGSGGTPAYMAPEQWRGEEGDARTDLYALGVILHQALTGEIPYAVTERGSFAAELGPARALPRRAGPVALRTLVRRMVERDPGRRPESTREVLEALARIEARQQGTWRRRVLWGTGAVAAGALALTSWLLLTREAAPGEQVAVVIAELESAPEPALDAVPGLLGAALEPSRRVKVLGPGRLAAVAHEAGGMAPGHLTAADARALARLAGAPVVLQPWARREFAGTAVGIDGIESESGRILFSARAEVSSQGGLAAAVDALSDQVRQHLHERARDRRLRRPVAEAVTASPEAARAYYEGLDCAERLQLAAGQTAQCVPAFERALALDPTFPLAHYQLARARFLRGDVPAHARPHLAAALAGVGRLPPREAQLVLALQAEVEGRTADALRAYDALLATDPEDVEVLRAAGDAYARAGDWASAARYLEKLAQVAPDSEVALGSLIEALGRTGRVEALAALRDRLVREAKGRSRLAVDACAWLGDHAGAVAVARRAVAAGEAEAYDTLQYALRLQGAFAEAEAAARQALASGATFRRRHALEGVLAAQGRVNEALRLDEESVREQPVAERKEAGFRQAMIAAAAGDAERVWRYAAQVTATAPDYGADLAVVLLLLGDAAHAAQLAPHLAPGGPAQAQYRALQRWRAGDAAGAAALLAREEARDPWPTDGVAPAYLLAEVAARSGDDVGALAGVDRFFRLPADRSYRAWAYPRALYLSALAHHRLGEDAAARDDLVRLLGLLARADRGVRLVGEARALEAQLRGHLALSARTGRR